MDAQLFLAHHYKGIYIDILISEPDWNLKKGEKCYKYMCEPQKKINDLEKFKS
jgi:hypothetical protein